MNLSDRIYQDLAAAIIKEIEIRELTLPALARRYQSSTRPVRQAVDALIKDGLLSKHENGRLEQNRKPAKTLKDKIRKKLKGVKEQPGTEAILLNHLIKRSLKGDESFIREETMAEKMKIGRSVLRRLFIDFAGRGLLEHIPRRGWKVIPFHEKDLENFNKVRKALEDIALCDAFDKLDEEDLKRLLAANKKIPGTQDNGMDHNLHHYIIERSENRYIQNFFKQNAPYYELLFEWEGQDKKLAREASRQHCSILQALIDKDLETARKALAKHLDFNHIKILKVPTK